MDITEIIERLKNIAEHAVHTVGERPFIMSLDDGIAVHEAIELLEKAETNLPEIPDSWIPFTADTMPKEDGEYFVLYDDMYAEDYDTGRVGVADFYVDCEAFGYWQESYDPVTLGFVDSDFVEIKVKKWMPIPKEEGEADGA